MAESIKRRETAWRRILSALRSVFWFDHGELAEIWSKLRAKKWGYETTWEISVLLALWGGVVFAFAFGRWYGIAYLWICKEAMQALNKKRFFDPMP